MADKGPPQKTQLLTDAPPEVQKAIDRQSQGGGGGGGAPRTMLMDAPNAGAAPQAARPQASPQMMQNRPAGQLPPVARKSSSAGRWIAGPLISIIVAAGTAAGARFVMPPPAKPAPVAAKQKGKLMLETEPASASVTIDGKPFPRFTPTEVEGEVGSTMRIGFKLDGYETKEEEVAIMAGQKTFKVTLEKSAPAAPAPVAAAAAPEPKKERRSSSSREPAAPKEPKAPKEPVGKGTLSVFVRPWAIVYIDGTRLRQTPVQGYELPSGKHTIELVNDPKGKKEKLQISLKPGESQEIRKDWDK